MSPYIKNVMYFLPIELELYQCERRGGGGQWGRRQFKTINNFILTQLKLLYQQLTSLTFLIFAFNFRYVSGEEGSQWEESWWTNLQILSVELKRFQVAATAGQSLLDSSSVIMRCGHMSGMWHRLPYKGIFSPQMW